MSVESIARALWVPGLDPSPKLLLVGIANHDGDGGAWPAMATLAGYLGCTERHAQRLVAELVQLGLVSVEHNAGGNGHTPGNRRPNRYTLHLPVDNHRPGVTRTSPQTPPGVTFSGSRGDIDPPPGVTHMSPKTSLLNRPTERATEPAAVVDNGRFCADCGAPLDDTRVGKWRCAPCQTAVDDLRARVDELRAQAITTEGDTAS